MRRRACLFTPLVAASLACAAGPYEPAATPATPVPAAVAPWQEPPELTAYLADIPATPPELSPEVTGVRGSDSATQVPRCQQTGWSYYQCDLVFPDQGLQWARWQCMHDPSDHARQILCSRLGEYLLRGVGGPPQPELGAALLERMCWAGGDAYRQSCYTAADELKFDFPDRSLAMARRGCDSDMQSPMGCPSLLATLEAGLDRRELVVTEVTGVRGVSAGDRCTAWIWTEREGTCGARFACGADVIYGDGGSHIPCDADRAGGEDMTTGRDGDPAFRIGPEGVTVNDDAAGLRGAFSVTAAP